MFNATLFRAVAAQALPESLYQQIAAPLELIIKSYEDGEALTEAISADLVYADRAEWERIYQIRREFYKANAADWPSFARTRWHDIDNYFDLDHDPKQDALPWDEPGWRPSRANVHSAYRSGGKPNKT
jgi:hypothetical protein